MSSITAQQFVQQGQVTLQSMQRTLREVDQAANRHQQQLQSLETSFEQALDELTAVNLPDLSRESIAKVRPRTGYGQFTVRDPLQKMAEERVTLTGRIQTIEADSLYINRDELIHPVTGSYTSQVNDLQQQVQAITQGIERFSRTSFFNELYALNYDTPNYPYRWWSSLRFYNDWKHGDEVSAALGFDSFRATREEYSRLLESRKELQGFLTTAQTQVKRVQDLVSSYDQAVYRLSNLEAVTLQECRQSLKEHLKFVDREQLFAWSGGDPSREALIKRVGGLEKKVEYLQQLADQQFGQERNQLQASITKLNKKVAKFSRPKYQNFRIAREESDLWLQDPSSRIRDRRERFWRDYDVIYVYDRYDIYDYSRDMLWWDLITDGRIDGNFIPEVQVFRSENPDYRYTRIANSGFSTTDSGFDPS